MLTTNMLVCIVSIQISTHIKFIVLLLLLRKFFKVSELIYIPFNGYCDTVIPHFIVFILLHFTDVHFVETEGLRQPSNQQICWCHFPIAFACFGSLCHILVSLMIFQIFHYYFIMVICDQ